MKKARKKVVRTAKTCPCGRVFKTTSATRDRCFTCRPRRRWILGREQRRVFKAGRKQYHNSFRVIKA